VNQAKKDFQIHKCIEHKQEFLTIFYALMTDEDFKDMISIATNSVRKVRGRFELMESKFRHLETLC